MPEAETGQVVALIAGIAAVCTYDPDYGRLFEAEGLRMMEPASIRQSS